MKSFSEIIETIKDIKGVKTNKAVAKLLKINYRTLCTQKRRKSIPHDELISFCRTENISTDKLFGEDESYKHENDLSQMGKETRPTAYLKTRQEDIYRQICDAGELLSLEDQESVLALITIFTSDDEETKIAIRQNIKQFHKLACGDKPIRGKPSEEKRISTGSPRRVKKAV